MSVCLIINPIHQCGVTFLTENHVEVRYASAPDMETVAREIEKVDAVVTRGAGLSKQAIAAAPRLRVIGSHGVGVDAVDVKAATQYRIPVVNTPLANYQSVAEHTVTLMLAVARRLIEADHAARSGDTGFKASADIRELYGKTIGIIGMGRVGARVAEMCKTAFGMHVVFYSPSANPTPFARQGMEKLQKLEDLFLRADVISIHVPLTAATRDLIGFAQFAQMRKGAMLINTSRGDVVDEAALIEALRAGRIFGAGLDVVSRQNASGKEGVGQSELNSLRNVVMTPHIAASTHECLERTAMQTVTQVLDVLAGRRAQHLVNAEIWDERRRC